MNKSLSPSERLKELNISLPPVGPPLGNYVSWTTVGDLFLTSGQFPWIDGDLKYTGKLGSDLTPEQGYQACRLAALNAVSQLQMATGKDFEKLKRIYRMEGVMNVAEHYNEHPKALDGASDILLELFGERAVHTRMIWVNNVMPLNSFCLIYIYAELLP